MNIKTLEVLILPILIILPLLASLFIFLVPKRLVQSVALFISLIEFFFGGVMVFLFDKLQTLQFITSNEKIPLFGIKFLLGVDGISLYFILLTVSIVPLLFLSFRDDASFNQKILYSLVFLVQVALLGVFTTQDAILFYVFWELAILPILFMILLWGEENKNTITIKFFVYTLVGSLCLLLSLLYLYSHTTTHSFSFTEITKTGASLGSLQQKILFLFLFLAFAIKIPLLPWHTWQANTYSQSPTPVTIILASLLLKMGVYGYVRILIPTLPQGVHFWQDTVLILCLIGMIYGGVVALSQKDFKKIIAYSSLSHLALSVAALFSMESIAIQGLIIQMFSHGFIIFGLLSISEIVQSKTHTRDIEKLGGLFQSNSFLASLLLLFSLASIAFPMMGGFVGEFLMLKALFTKNLFYGLFGALGMLLGAIFMLQAFQKIMLGKIKATHSNNDRTFALVLREKVSLLLCLFVIFAIGLFPSYLFQNTENISQLYIEKFYSFFLK